MVTAKKSSFMAAAKFLTLCVIIFISASSCYEDVVDIDLSEFDHKIVIEGAVGNYAGPYTVAVGKTTKLSSDENIKRISGASVVIRDDQGFSEVLQEESAGIYQTSSLRGRTGRTYTLNVEANGETYTASSTMQRAVLVNGIDFVKEDAENDYYDLVLSIDNLADTPEYCKIDIYKNEYFTQSYIYSDQYADGQDVQLDDFYASFIPSDFVQIYVISIDKNVYEFYRSLEPLEEIFWDMDDPFAAGTLYNPASNISNGALGCFSAHSVRSYETFVAWEL